MKIDKFEELLMLCKEQIPSSDTLYREVEAVLVRGLLVSLCSEYENKLKELVKERCSYVSDDGMRSYAASYTKKDP